MEPIVKLRNRTTGVVSEVPETLWNEKKSTPLWRGVFELVTTVKIVTPPEVLELEAKTSTKKPAKPRKPRKPKQ